MAGVLPTARLGVHVCRRIVIAKTTACKRSPRLATIETILGYQGNLFSGPIFGPRGYTTLAKVGP
jgi:hypothetical protein